MGLGLPVKYKYKWVVDDYSIQMYEMIHQVAALYAWLKTT